MVETECPECGERIRSGENHECDDESSEPVKPEPGRETGERVSAVIEVLDETLQMVQREVVGEVGFSHETEGETDTGSSGTDSYTESGEKGGDLPHVRGESETKREAAIRLMDTRPELSNGEIADRVGTSRSYIENIRSERE